ncbi:hypothetical protein L209DRAFT_384427 [Thermothelomyces heterothallicus CBS 203.75]
MPRQYVVGDSSPFLKQGRAVVIVIIVFILLSFLGLLFYASSTTSTARVPWPAPTYRPLTRRCTTSSPATRATPASRTVPPRCSSRKRSRSTPRRRQPTTTRSPSAGSGSSGRGAALQRTPRTSPSGRPTARPRSRASSWKMGCTRVRLSESVAVEVAFRVVLMGPGQKKNMFAFGRQIVGS